MKNTKNIFGIIAFLAVIAFLLLSCIVDDSNENKSDVLKFPSELAGGDGMSQQKWIKDDTSGWVNFENGYGLEIIRFTFKIGTSTDFYGSLKEKKGNLYTIKYFSDYYLPAEYFTIKFNATVAENGKLTISNATLVEKSDSSSYYQSAFSGLVGAVDGLDGTYIKE